MNRILVIRGGAIGDFILTLPAIKLLRDRFPQAHLEILGYTHIAVLGRNRFHADAIRSLESGPLAAFFAKGTALPADLAAYFGSFDLIASYLFDPDGVFQDNLKRCGIKMFVAGPPKPNGPEHAAFQLARPFGKIGLDLQNPAARIHPTELNREFAREMLGDSRKRVIALHPGSGSETKNWPIENWKRVGEHFFSIDCKLLVIAGEAEEEQLRLLETAWKEKPARFVKNLALPHLAALFETCVFVGHDSGISHIAAAVGAPSILLFGPTDPAVWAPANKNVTVLQARERDLSLLAVDTVIEAILTVIRLDAAANDV
jgi:heptosyltransferase III